MYISSLILLLNIKNFEGTAGKKYKQLVQKKKIYIYIYVSAEFLIKIELRSRLRLYILISGVQLEK